MAFPAPGSIAFLGYDADDIQRLAIVAVDDLPAGSVIYITDRAWNGSSFVTGSEGTLTWTVPAGGITAGTVVSFNQVNSIPTSPTTSSTYLSAEIGGVPTPAGSVQRTGGFDTQQANEVLYAYVGTISGPTTFLAAIGNGPSSPNTGGDAFASTSNGVLTGTGLVAGQTAVNLAQVDGGADFAVYRPDLGGSNFMGGLPDPRTAMLNAINNPANWLTGDGRGDQSTPYVPFLTNTNSPIHDVTFVICYLSGTRIATPSGEVAVEELRPGDLVLLADGRTLPVRWLGRQRVLSAVARRSHALPIRIQAGALGEGLPRRDLLVSPGHAIGFGDALVNAGALVNGTTIREETDLPWVFTYWHVELAEHALLLAEGVPAESFLDTVEPMRFDNGAERPEFPPVEEMDLPRASSRRQVPQRVRALVAERAAALAGADAAAA